MHELGHGFAAKNWGGEVHEIGIMLLVLMPVPYVEASSASAFREKHKRIVVGAAGIMVELFLAALAIMLWLNVEPGPIRALAFNVMLIGGVSTIFLVGWAILLAASIWLIYRIAKGWVYLSEQRPMPS